MRNATMPIKPPRWTAQHRHVLHVMADLFCWRTLVEVGVWKGDTGAYLLEVCPKLHYLGVDPYRVPEGSLDEPGFWQMGRQEDLDRVYEHTKSRLAQYRERATLLREPSVAAAKSRAESFDCVFLDGDHRYEHVQADIEAWAPHVNNGGWLCGHDYDMPPVRKAVLERFSRESVRELPDRVWAFQF